MARIELRSYYFGDYLVGNGICFTGYGNADAGANCGI